MRTLLFVAVLGLSSVAWAADVDTPPASCFAHPDRWTYERAKEPIAGPGERFLDDMRACDPTFAAAVVEAIRYKIQTEETEKFIHQRGFVIAAYAIAWGVLAAAALALWLRQRRLTREIAELESRLKAAGGAP
jgi:tRNA(Ile2) C34 agmatinyltransferase TiaS